VDKGVVDVKADELLRSVKNQTVPLIWYMGKGNEPLQKMCDKLEADNERIVIPTNVRCLANLRTTRERRQIRDIAA